MRLIKGLNRRKNQYRPGLESVEKRELMVASVATELAFIGIGMAADVALEKGTESNISGQLGAISNQLKQIDGKIDTLDLKVNLITAQLNRADLTSATASMALPDIETYWNTYLNMTDPLLRPNYTDQAVEDFAKGVRDKLNSVPLVFSRAFDGQANDNGTKDVMKAYSDVIKGSSKLLTSSYTTAMNDAFDYYMSKWQQSVHLLVNANEILGYQQFRIDVESARPLPGNDLWNAAVGTMPALAIPDGAVLDTQSKKLWQTYSDSSGNGYETDFDQNRINNFHSSQNYNYGVRPAGLTNYGTPVIYNADFEHDQIGSDVRYNLNNPWNLGHYLFLGRSGVAGNGSSLTGGNASGPNTRNTVAFLQQTGSISQMVWDWTEGNYTISFDAAQRQNVSTSNQRIQIWVDDTLVQTMTPSSTSYTNYTTVPFYIGSDGGHVVKFVGLSANDGNSWTDDNDDMAFIDNLGVTRQSLALPTVSNPGFAASGQATYGNFTYNPTGVSNWTFDGSSGVSGTNSAFTSGNPWGGTGVQFSTSNNPVAFLQWAGSMSQTIPNIGAGFYNISLLAAQRGNHQASRQDFQVLVDDKVITTITPLNTSYLSYSTPGFYLPAGSHTIKLKGLDTAGGDNTAFIDNVRINFDRGMAQSVRNLQPTAATNSGFESFALNYGYIYNPSDSGGWTFSSESGVTGSYSGFTERFPVYQGANAAFIQNHGEISQSVTDWVDGYYTISFLAAQRGNIQSSSQNLQLWVDDQMVGTFNPNGTSYSRQTSKPFRVSAGSHNIRFVGLNTAGGDNTAFIDDVQVNLKGHKSVAPLVQVSRTANNNWNLPGQSDLTTLRTNARVSDTSSEGDATFGASLWASYVWTPLTRIARGRTQYFRVRMSDGAGNWAYSTGTNSKLIFVADARDGFYLS